MNSETNNRIKTNLELYDEYMEMLQRKHPDTLYSPDPKEYEEEIGNEPKLSMEDLEILVNRPLPADAAPEDVELHKACREFYYGTLVPNEEFLKRLEAGEFDGSKICMGESDPGEDDPETAEIPSLIENEDDNH